MASTRDIRTNQVDISCDVCGCEKLIDELQKQLGIGLGEVTADGEIGLLPIVCLGHCEKAPCLLANERVYGPLQTDAESVRALLQRIRDDRSAAQG